MFENETIETAKMTEKKTMSTRQTRRTSVMWPIFGTSCDENLTILKSCTERQSERNCLSSLYSFISSQSSKYPRVVQR